MSEVGVLQLTIRDNSQEAATGLDNFADALSRAQEALGNGLKLGNMSKSLKAFGNAIAGQHTALKNTGTFLNSIAEYKKAFKDAESIKFNVQPIADLKAAIGDGFKVGSIGTQMNSLRDAFEKDWPSSGKVSQISNSLKIISSGIEAIPSNTTSKANSISALGKALAEYAKACDKLKSSIGVNMFSGITGVSSQIDKAKSNVDNYKRSTLLPLNLQMHGFKRPNDDLGMDVNAISHSIESASSDFVKLEETIHSTTDAARELKVELQEVGNVVTSISANPFEEMYQSFSKLSYELGWFKKESLKLTSGESPLLLGDGRTPGQLLLGDGSEPQTFLSVWRDAGEQWKQNWVFFASEAAKEMRAKWSPDWIMGGQSVPQSMQSFHLPAGQAPLLLGDGGVSPENMLSEWRDLGEQWKPDFIIGEGTVSESAEEMSEAAAATRDFAQSMEELRTSAGDTAGFDPAIEFARQWNNSTGNTTIADSAKENIEWVNNLVEKGSEIDLLNMKISSLTDKLYEGVSSGKMTGDQIANTIAQIQRLREEVEQLTASTSGMRGAWNDFKNGMKGLFPTISSMISRLKQIAKYRMLRSVIKHITSGFTEGVQNVYQYSKAIGGTFASAMDDAATALQQMKNSIGAAVAPAIQALIPYLQIVVNWIITGINYLNQFFALLNGQKTWTRALPETAEAFEKQKKNAKGASKAMKDLLADWDELNIIQSKNSGSGSGGTGKTAEEYKNMFEEVGEFSDRVREVVAFIDDHLGGIPELLKTAGAILLGWKFSKAFKGILGKLGGIIAGLESIKIGFELAYGGGFEAGKKGFFDTGDILASIGGTLASALGGWLIGNAIAGPAGGAMGVVIGIGIGVVGTIYGWIEGQKDAADISKWGNLHRTADEIEAFVKKQFTFDVVGQINMIDQMIQNEDLARNKLNEEITKFSESLNKATITIDADVPEGDKIQAILQAATDAQSAITALNNLINTNLNTLDFTLSEFTFTDSEGNEINTTLKETAHKAAQDVQDYFTGIGKELAGYIAKGEKEGLTESEQEAALALMKRQMNILDEADRLKREYKQRTDLLSGLSSVKNIEDRDTALAEIQREKELIDQWTTEAEGLVQRDIENMTDLAAKTQAAANDARRQGKKEIADDYEKDAKDLLAQIEQLKTPEGYKKAVEEKLAPSIAIMKEYWGNLLRAAYGQDIDETVLKETAPKVDRLWYWVDSAFNEGLKHASESGKGSEFLQNWLTTILGYNKTFDPTGMITTATESLGISLWDLLSDASKQNLYMNIADIFGNTEDATKLIMDAFGLNEEEVKPYVDHYLEYFGGEIKDGVEGTKFDIKDADPFDWLPKYEIPETEEQTVSVKPEIDFSSLPTVEEWIDLDDEGNEIPITIDPVVDATEAHDKVVNAINSAMEDAAMSDYEKQQIIDRFGEDMYNQVLKELDYNLDSEGFNRGMVPSQWDPRNMPTRAAGMVVSDVNWSHNTPVNEPTEVIYTERKNNQQESDNVASGVQKGNADVVSELRSVVMQLTKLLNKEWSVNISPTSDLGMVGRRAAEAAARAFGDGG